MTNQGLFFIGMLIIYILITIFIYLYQIIKYGQNKKKHSLAWYFGIGFSIRIGISGVLFAILREAFNWHID